MNISLWATWTAPVQYGTSVVVAPLIATGVRAVLHQRYVPRAGRLKTQA
jgi:hypothetical protein